MATPWTWKFLKNVLQSGHHGNIQGQSTIFWSSNSRLFGPASIPPPYHNIARMTIFTRFFFDADNAIIRPFIVVHAAPIPWRSISLDAPSY